MHLIQRLDERFPSLRNEGPAVCIEERNLEQREWYIVHNGRIWKGEALVESGLYDA
jgi:hypothetical protein